MKFTNIFDRAYGLYLDERISNYNAVNKIVPHEKFVAGKGKILPIEEYNHIDIQDKPPVYLNSINYATWHVRSSAYNAWLCHQKIFRKFYNDPEKPNRLLLFEDDIFFHSDWEAVLHLENVYNKLISLDWDMFYFGCYNNGKHLKVSDNVLKLNGAGGFHCVGMTREIVGKLLEFPPIGPYDWIAGKYLHSEYKCYAVYPTVVDQASGYSYIEGHNLEKPDRWYNG